MRVVVACIILLGEQTVIVFINASIVFTLAGHFQLFVEFECGDILLHNLLCNLLDAEELGSVLGYLGIEWSSSIYCHILHLFDSAHIRVTIVDDRVSIIVSRDHLVSRPESEHLRHLGIKSALSFLGIDDLAFAWDESVCDLTIQVLMLDESNAKLSFVHVGRLKVYHSNAISKVNHLVLIGKHFVPLADEFLCEILLKGWSWTRLLLETEGHRAF